MSQDGGAPMVNPFEQALIQTMQLFPNPSPGYKSRVFGQLTLCALLMAVSLIYVILHHLHARATGMPSWLFKAQQGPKSKWGSPIMVNSMLAFTILAFLGAGGQLGSRYYNYLVFIKGRKPLGYTAAQFTPWVPVFVQAWFFSITNLQATVAARAKLGSRFRGILNPFLHNFILLGLPVVYVVMILPIALVVSAKQDTLFQETWALEPILRRAAADFAAGGMPSMELISQLTQYQTILLGKSHEFKEYIVVLCALCMGLSALIGLMNAYNLFLVCILRSSLRTLKKHAWRDSSHLTSGATLGPKPALGIDWDELGAGAAFQGQNSAGSATVCDSFVHSTIPTFGLHSSKHGKTGPGTAFAPSPQDIAMRRLTADLSITIPCLLAMVIIMVVGLAVIIEKQFDNITWTIQEFTMDGFCYIYTSISILAVLVLIFNLLRAWRIQRVVGPLNSGTDTLSRSHTSVKQPEHQHSAVAPVMIDLQENGPSDSPEIGLNQMRKSTF